MRSPLKLSALLAFFFLAFSLVGGTGVGAQDDMESEFQPSDLEGIQYGVARSWSMDYEALFAESTPGSDEFTMPSGILFMGGMVIEFDNDGNAEAGFDRVQQEFSTEDLMMENGAEVEEWDIEVGNQNVSYYSMEETEGVQSEIVITIVQDANYVYIISAAGTDMDMKGAAQTIVQTMVDNEGSGEGEFSEDGTSTGGLWDKLPAPEDEVVVGLIATDEIFYPVPEE